jgi:uncharacterized membrane protein YhaH (DUF805 family)
MALFSFNGRIRRVPYAFWSLAVFFSQHLVVLLAFRSQGQSLGLSGSLTFDWAFYVLPLRWLVTLQRPSDLMLILALADLLIAAWVLSALAFRRARDGNVNGWIAVFAVAPLVQIPAIVFLSLVPSRVPESRSTVDAGVGPTDIDWAAAAQGVVAGMGLTLAAVATSTLVFGAYGFGLFVVSPVVIGATTAYFANRKRDLGAGRTARLVTGATALGGVALVIAALEGIVCIILASPLALGAALVGSLLGRAIARYTSGSPRQTVPALVLLPLLFALENAWAATTSFVTYETIEVRAPPEVIWRALVHMDPIDEPLALPFRLGVAYPISGEVIGEGVDAVRRGRFSTGTAVERVTEWLPNRKLAFAVVDDVPAMHELSPYEHVHAPHVIGYFRTTDTSFELVPRADGGTDILERTAHELRLDPVLYWLPLARWVIHENNTRVLNHIRRQAERSAGVPG